MELAYDLLKKLKEKVDDAIIIHSNSKSYQVKFVNSKIVKTNTEFSENISLFIAKEKKTVFTSLKDLEKKTATETVEKLLSFLKKTHPNENYFGIAQGPFLYKKVPHLYDKKIEKLDERHTAIVEEAVHHTESYKIPRASGILESRSVENLLLTTGKVEKKERGTSLYFSIRCLTNENSSGHATSCSRTLHKFTYKNATQKAIDIALSSKNPQPCPSGRYEIIFQPLACAPLLNTVASSCSIFNVESHFSFFMNKLNKKVGNTLVNLSDHGNLENGFASSECDSEGFPTQRTPLIEKGILKNYLFNYSYAQKYKTKSTGNAGIMMPAPTNTILEPGTSSEEEMIKETKKGILVTNVWYTRFQNYAKGDFSTIPRDGIFLIKNGKIVRPIKSIRISDNIINILKNVVLLSKEREQIVSWEAESPVISPVVQTKNIHITKPKE